VTADELLAGDEPFVVGELKPDPRSLDAISLLKQLYARRLDPSPIEFGRNDDVSLTTRRPGTRYAGRDKLGENE
jgi:hypothetical protein